MRQVIVASILVGCLVAFTPAISANTIAFTESLDSNPFSPGGNFGVSNAPGLAPDTYNQFTWDGSTAPKYTGDSTGSLKVVYDSTKPAVRLERALPTTVGIDQDFSFGTRMTVRSNGLVAPDTDYFEMTFGLAGHAATGGDRTGSMTTSADVYNQVEFAYFPNLAFWGGPTLQVNAFGAQIPGKTPFNNYASPDFNEGDLGGNGAGQIKSLPLNTPLDVDISYKASTQIATLKVSRVESNGSLTQLMLSDTGVIDIDLSGAGFQSGSFSSNNFDKTHPFSLDTLVVSSYFDSWASIPGSPSLYANVEYDQFRFQTETVPEPLSLLLLASGAMVVLRRWSH